MENESSIARRGRTLEAEFFHRVDQKLMEELRAKMKVEAEKQQLESNCGLHDQNVLDELVRLGITSESMVGLSLVPLVRVAWADGKIKDAERQAVLKAAKEDKCPVGSASYQLLEHCLEEAPSAALVEAWQDYISSLRATMIPEAFATLRKNVSRRAREVAMAAGGILGIHKISKQEADVLDEIDATFQG